MNWIDAFIKQAMRGVPESEREERTKEIPQVRKLLEAAGKPDWLNGGREIGKRGEYKTAALSPEELAELRQHIEDAQEIKRSFIRPDDEQPITPSESDLIAALHGKGYFKTCPTPESQRAFVHALELQALSLSMENREMFVGLVNGDDCALQSIRSEALWVKSGLPYVQINDAQWCANLMATGLHPEFSELVEAPWPAFRIAIPHGLLSIEQENGHPPDPCVRVMVMRDDHREWAIILEGSRKMMHVAGESTKGLCEADVERLNLSDIAGLRLTGRDGKVMRLAARLVMAVCLKLDQASDRPKPKFKRLQDGSRRASEPILRRYTLGRPISVTVDARPALREYLSGTGRGTAPTVQCMVRGHWKYQPHGPGRSGRKFIHIEPYWRGPDDAPIAVRPHVLKASPEEQRP